MKTVEEKVFEEIEKQVSQGGEVTPYSVSRALGYRLSGRISKHLKSLEEGGKISRRYETANECFISLKGLTHDPR